MLRASYRPNNAVRDTLGFKLGGPSAVPQLIAFALERARLFSVRHGLEQRELNRASLHAVNNCSREDSRFRKRGHAGVLRDGKRSR